MTMATAFHWVPGERPPPIEEHSLAKLRVLRHYIRAYIDTLNQNVRKEQFKLDLVDGFAGGGLYLRNGSEVSGSPLVMLEESQKAEQRLNEQRTKKLRFDVKHHFVEKDPAHARYLRSVLAERGHLRNGDQIALYEQSFDEVLDRIVSDIRERQPYSQRSIFLLDQYGYTDADIQMVQRIGNRLRHAEVILTVSVSTMLNSSNSENIVARLYSMGIPKHRVDAVLRMSSDLQIKALMQRALPGLVLDSTVFQWFTPFFIRPAKSRRELWFVHFSRNAKARDVMLDCHWNCHNTFAHYGDSLGLKMLGFDGLTPDQVLPTFSDRDRSIMKAGIADQLMPELNDRLKVDHLPFAGMIDHFGNRTAATIADFNDIVVAARDAGEIRIVGPDGRPRDSRLQTLHGGDMLTLPPQLRLPIGRR